MAIRWAHQKAADERCVAVDVVIENADSTLFVTPQGIIEDLGRNGFKVIGKPMWQIDASLIEEVLGRSDFLEKVECVKAQNGRLLVRVTQLIPVARVFDGDDSYYVNRNGKRMTATANYHADVPVVQGHFTLQYPVTRLLPMIEYVERDSLLSALVGMISVRDSNNIFVVPTIYGHIVNMGDASGYDKKFAQLQLFYRKVMPSMGWENYDTISVKWHGQVVATRRTKAVKVDVPYDASDDEPDLDLQTIAVDDDNHTLAAEKAKSQPTPKRQ